MPGGTANGAAVSDSWTSPTIVGRFGPAGEDGTEGVDGADGSDGTDGVDGQGIEYVFAATAAASVPSAKRPSNAWGYDSRPPGRSDVDGRPPNLSDATPYLWRCQRKVPGGTANGAAVSDSWSLPVISGRFGPAGTDAIDVQNASAVFVSTDGGGTWSSASQELQVTFRRDGVSLGSATVYATVTGGSRLVGQGTTTLSAGVTLAGVQNAAGIRVWRATHTASGATATLTATLEVSGYVDRGPWVSGRNFAVDDVVSHTISLNLGLGAYNPNLGNVNITLRFRATTAHTSSNAQRAEQRARPRWLLDAFFLSLDGYGSTLPPLDTGPSNPRWQEPRHRRRSELDIPVGRGCGRFPLRHSVGHGGRWWRGCVGRNVRVRVWFPEEVLHCGRHFPFTVSARQSGRWGVVRLGESPWAPRDHHVCDGGDCGHSPEAGTVQFTVAVAGNFDSYTTVWSVVSGLGSIDSDGVYSTGDIGPQTSNVAATVRATVTAIGDGTNADVGHSATATDDEAFVVAPYPAPTLVAASGDGRVDLSWAIPSAWSAFSLRWDVQRKLSSASSWTQVAQVTSPSYRASGLNNGTSYDFRVRAIDPAGAPVTPDSPWSGTVSATPEALAYPYPDAQSGGPYVARSPRQGAPRLCV